MRQLNEASQKWFGNYVTATGDGRVPCSACIDGQAWNGYFHQYRERLSLLKAECPDVSFGFPASDQKVGRTGRETVIDAWGCEWLYNETAGDGQAVAHPLQDWAKAAAYEMPNPESYMDWARLKEQVSRQRAAGEVASIGLEHGFFFLRLGYLRGFEGFMLDIAEQSTEFRAFFGAFTEFWVEIAKRIAALEPDLVYWADDLGMQSALPMSPRSWREVMKPAYRQILQACRASGGRVFLHTDGYIVDIIPDLIECGVDVLNPQDLVNGLDNLALLAKGRVSINLDIDRQLITPFGKPEEVRQHIGNCVKTLGSQKGGLSLIYGAYLGVPIENLEAVVRAMQEFEAYWCQG